MADTFSTIRVYRNGPSTAYNTHYEYRDLDLTPTPVISSSWYIVGTFQIPHNPSDLVTRFCNSVISYQGPQDELEEKIRVLLSPNVPE